MRTLITALTFLALTLTACGGQEKDSGSSSSTAFNDADVAFATDMIPHHAQALAMVDTTWNQRLDPEVARRRHDGSGRDRQGQVPQGGRAGSVDREGPDSRDPADRTSSRQP